MNYYLGVQGCGWGCVCVCVCVSKTESERERECVGVRLSFHMCMWITVFQILTSFVNFLFLHSCFLSLSLSIPNAINESLFRATHIGIMCTHHNDSGWYRGFLSLSHRQIISNYFDCTTSEVVGWMGGWNGSVALLRSAKVIAGNKIICRRGSRDFTIFGFTNIAMYKHT